MLILLSFVVVCSTETLINLAFCKSSHWLTYTDNISLTCPVEQEMASSPNVLGFPGGSVIKNPPVNAGDTGSIPGSGRSPGGGNGNPLQFSYLGNLTDRGAWQAIVHGVTKKIHVYNREISPMKI